MYRSSFLLSSILREIHTLQGMDEFTIYSLKISLLAGVIGLVLYKTFTGIRSFKAYARVFNDCPGEKEWHWIFGTLHLYPGPNEAGIKYDIESMEKRPRFSRVWVGPFTPVLILYHPELNRLVLKSSAPKPRGGLMVSVYEMGLGWLGEGLLISNGARWARSRRLLTPAFHFDILKPYMQCNNRAGDVLLEKIKQFSVKNQSLEVFHNISLCLFDILLQCAFSHKSNCQTTGVNDPFVQSVNELVSLWSERSLKPYLHFEPFFRLSSQGRRWYKVCDYVHSVSEELINKRRKTLEEKQQEECENGIGKKTDDEPGEKEKKRMLCFVDILLTAKDTDGKGMTPMEIRNEADTFLFEGFDTTTSALSWTLYALARWPQHQKLVQEEIDDLLRGRNSDDILWDDLNNLPYTTACIKEAMRNYSTVPFIERQTTETINIDGHIIPPGTFVAVQLWCLHHNPTVWEKPHDYIPDRFLGDNALKMDPFQFTPFSAGPRNCIGQNFAMHELKVLVARIFHRYTLTLDPDHEVLRAPFATFKAEKDIKLFASPR